MGGFGSGCVCVFAPSEGGPGGPGSSGTATVLPPMGSGSGGPATALPPMGSGSGGPATVLPPMGSGSGGPVTGATALPTVPTVNGTGAGSGVTSSPGVTVPNPGSAGGTFAVTIRQTWSQETAGYDRPASVKVPTTTAGQKLPLVVD